MGEWKEQFLEEVMTLKRGYDLSAAKRTPGSVPIVTSSGFGETHNEAMAQPPGVVTGRYGTIGQVFFVTVPYWPLNTTLYVRDFKGNDERFIYYFLKTFDFEKYNDKSTIPGINRNHLYTERVRIPGSLDEQRAIASVLSSLDAKIDLLHRQNKTLEAMAEALFRQWFVEEAEEGWAWVQLSEHIRVHRGLSYTGSGLCGPDEGVPMHNLNSVYEGGGYKYEGIKYYKGEYRERHIIKPGELIITNTEQGHDQLLIGCPAIIPRSLGEEGIFSQHVYRIEMLNPLFTGVFVKHLVLTSAVREQLTGSTNGSTVNMLPADGIEMAKFQLPPKDKIERFNAIAAPLQQKQEKNYIQIQTLIAQRDTLLPKLMSGEVRVEMNSNPHPAIP